MKIKFATLALILTVYSSDLIALTVTVDFGDATLNSLLSATVENEIETALAKYSEMPKLARGFGNANTYASGVATLRGYQGYDIFVIAVGSMVSVQAPGSDPMFFKKVQDELKNGDSYTGVGGNPIVVHGGMNLGFLIDGLTMSFKYGNMNLKTGHEYGFRSYKYELNMMGVDIEYDSNLYSLLFNYQLVREKSILAGVLMWRGLTIGSGLAYSNNKISLYSEQDALDPIIIGTYTINVDPSVDFVLRTKSLVVPIEVYTSIRLMYLLNLGFGAGLDYVPYGKVEYSLKSNGSIVATNSLLPGVDINGTANIDTGDLTAEADKFRYRLMINLGLSLGPVFIDVPLTYYFTDNGYAAGITAGMSF